MFVPSSQIPNFIPKGVTEKEEEIPNAQVKTNGQPRLTEFCISL